MDTDKFLRATVPQVSGGAANGQGDRADGLLEVRLHGPFAQADRPVKRWMLENVTLTTCYTCGSVLGPTDLGYPLMQCVNSRCRTIWHTTHPEWHGQYR